MTDHNPGYTLERLPFRGALPPEQEKNARMRDWPAVYVIDNEKQVYVGETTNVVARRGQHHMDPRKARLTTMRVVLHDEFNKSAALDLERYLIQMLSGDGAREVLNRNAGMTESDYYDRTRYQEMFADIFERLRAEKVFSRSREQILNSTLFKLSPFKVLTPEQEASLRHIIQLLVADDDVDRGPLVIQGGPGTGKTVVGVFLAKLLVDLANLTEEDVEVDLSSDHDFFDLFTHANRNALLRGTEGRGLRIGIVVPQQSLRQSLKRVFRRTPGLHPSMVLSVWNVGDAEERYDILIVDEAHRLGLRSAQSNGALNNKYTAINQRLFGDDDVSHTQLDWITQQARDVVLLVDPRQTVRPADLDAATMDALLARAHAEHRHHALVSQLRVKASDSYVDFFGKLLRGEHPPAPDLGEYDLRLFTDFGAMREAIRARDTEFTLARLAAGFAWKWQSKGFRTNPSKPDWDIELDGVRMPWNVADTDWVDSPGSLDEIGSIHTLQGYDLNYAGVVIGPDLQWDDTAQRVVFSRADYADTGGKKNNGYLSRTYSDEDLREYVINIYNVLLTRGVRGTYLYVVDAGLREQFARWFPGISGPDVTSAPFGIPPGGRPGEVLRTVDVGHTAEVEFIPSTDDLEQARRRAEELRRSRERTRE